MTILCWLKFPFLLLALAAVVFLVSAAWWEER
jgi:hypothetical protein